MWRVSRRSVTVKTLAILMAVGLVRPGFGSPGSVLDMDAPILGGEKPATRDIQDGDASVSTQTGAFTYSYPVTVPPGRLGMQPSLTLSYSSQAPLFGGVAAGWSLSLPEIRRDPTQSRLAKQSPDFVQRWVSSMAGGHELVPVAEPTVASDVAQAYRAQYDGTYARYERLTNCTWRVRTTDGMTHEFALPDHLGFGSGSCPDTWRAPLTRTTDPFGNQVDYYWTQVLEDTNSYLAEYVIDHIDYTLNTSHGINAPHARVRFEYPSLQSCTGGLPVGAKLEIDDQRHPHWSGSKRLDSIHTEVRDGASFRPVRTVSLAYDQEAASCDGLHGPIRLLTSIQEQAFAPTQNWLSARFDG